MTISTPTPVKSTSKSQKVKQFSVCLYIPYDGYRRRLNAEEEERGLGEVNTAGVGFGYFGLLAPYGGGYGYNYAYAGNLAIDYVSAVMYDCDTEVELGTYGVSCIGDSGVLDFIFGEPVQSDCEHNFAFNTGNPGSALVIHTSDSDYTESTTVTTLGASGKFSKAEVTNVELFGNLNDSEEDWGFTFTYKTRGYNPLYWKDQDGPKKSHST
jgi:hypothetical protein